MNYDDEIPADERDDPEESVTEPVTDMEVTSVSSPAPLWAGLIFTIWIIANYVTFYYFLVAHRYESFALGG